MSCRSSPSNEENPQLHDISGVQVSTAEAVRLDTESTKHLLSQRKLALIVDLDQTIIHATVDPTVGEWMKDTNNPNFTALSDVGKFLLGTDGKALVHSNDEKEKNEKEDNSDVGCWYYVKPRPNLQQFLQELSTKYEMHVYTMGTRTYAESVCKLVDPQGTIFGARILSRDENGSLLQKSLSKLFPVDTSMVVIIDDRADVWQWSPNLVRVSPFDFFVGSGDINASFLPSTPELPTPPNEVEKNEGPAEESAKEDKVETQGDSSRQASTDTGELSAQEKQDNIAAQAAAEESQKHKVSEQLDRRPLAKMQQELEGKRAEQATSTPDTDQSTASDKDDVAWKAVLKEDDRELDHIQGVLQEIHKQWYESWDAAQVDSVDGPHDKPSITGIVWTLKSAVLSGCVIVFSSIVPMHHDPASSDLWRMAVEFGATCKRAIDSSVTHVVSVKPGTEKVINAQRRNIHAVWHTWLQDSCAKWTRQPESDYEFQKSNRAWPADDDRDSPEESAAFASSSHNGLEDESLDEKDQQGFDEMNWDEANDEIDAVLAGLSDDSEADDSEGWEETDQKATTKRQRGEKVPDTPPEQDESPDLTLSPLSKRRKVAEMRSGQSKLKQALDQNDAPSTPGGESDFLQSLEEELELQLGGTTE